ncbi:Predicted amidohydrolase [Palleronia marisminoris]|uniref:C-N hydrolase family amidase n=1 Tax=Palleronia marisminoris TaxID=315423 RepID=A0A1Y5SLK9_9RHOB|nr:nitrilase-related carbon-nitrogen hydrolase [Palleronia marisminoris]SFG84011.1 Predicted amidohydrolase [Palleronia marisminoris]SLN41833.1 C-N hydrolase family amidase [Palleronia marisminoris]
MRVASATWPLERHADWQTYAAKLEAWVTSAEADLLVFPEYAGMEPCLTTPPARDTPQDWVDHAARTADDVLALNVDLAQRCERHILMGSLPVASEAGLVNRAHLIAPSGTVLWQDKQIPTPYERAHTTLVPGDPLRVFDTGLGRIGVLVCHDAEFPLLARAQPCDVLLIPACTDAPHGAARVRAAARARALEGACVTALSQTIGDVEGCCFLDTNRSGAGIFAPPDRGFPDDGILAQVPPKTSGWARAEVDMDALAALKDGRGEVAIPLDWPRSERAEQAPRVRLD